MKVDTSKLKKASSDISPECRLLIEQMVKCRTRSENLEFLRNIRVWVYGKCELYHWIEILDRFDNILEEAVRYVDGNEFVLYCDTSYTDEDIHLLLCVLNFTTLLIEHSFSRHLYNSIEHLTQLISSQNLDISLAVLNLLYMFSKRSNFIPRLPFVKKEILLIKLFNIAERWGDPNYGLALIDCCIKNPKQEFLYQLLIDYINDTGTITLLEIPDLMELSKSVSSSEAIKLIYDQLPNPSVAVKTQILHKARLIAGFNDRKIRLQFVQARLQAVSVLIYSNALQENSDRILYPGFGEELCELIDKEDNYLVDIRSAVLRTLTSMLHFDRNHNIPKPGSRLPKIIHYTGAERQGGMLPLLVRDCISSLTGLGTILKYPISLATSLFSLLYHLASYEAGGQALVRSGMMQSLICVINWAGVDLEHITFVTRAVRVIDLITNIDIAKFHLNHGLNAFIQRLEKEINNCRDEIANVHTHCNTKINDAALYDDLSQLPDETMQDASPTVPASSKIDASESNLKDGSFIQYSHDIDIDSDTKKLSDNNLNSEMPTNSLLDRNPTHSYGLSSRDRNLKQTNSPYTKKISCVTQRAALLKSMLNFLKKCIQDHAHYNGMRNIMESSLPCSLRHIISMAEYYGPSLFLLATDVITVHVFNEPSILSSLQDSGLTNIMLKSLLHKGVPATREVLGSLPNIFSALCLNERGLIEFMAFEPFDKLLKVLISPDYLVAMRRRRSSDPLGDTATNLGNAMDDLIKHHPYLRTDASEAIVRLLNELVRLGSDPNYICWRAHKDLNYSGSKSNCHVDVGSQDQNMRSANAVPKDRNNENDSSEEEEDDDEEISSTSQQQQGQNCPVVPPKTSHIRNSSQEREAIPLIDYIINVMKFIEATLSNSSNGDHCRQLVLHGGLKPLLQLLSLPNLPVDSPVSLTAQAIANVCKSIINLTQETKVIDTALEQLSQIVGKLQPLIKHENVPGGSVLLYELLTCPNIEDGFSNADYTPLLHNMSSVHGYVVMLVHICRNASAEMRTILLQRWGFDSISGIQLLQNLVQLYISLVWESTVLLSFCSDEPVLQSSDCWDEIINFNSKEEISVQDKKLQSSYKKDQGISSKIKKSPEEQLRFIKSLLAASSRLGRALAELFGTLVKLSVGSPQSRQRRNNDFLSTLTNSKFPSSDAKKIARVLSSILVNGFRHENFVPKPVPKLRLTFLICSVGFTGPMLFDDKRSCFHLMVSQFCEEKGLDAFFDMFNWALSIGSEEIKSNISNKNSGSVTNLLNDPNNDEADFPEGTGEFLDAWLQLLEKMVNPRAILDSPYALATARQPQSSRILNFEPVFYLTEVHQLAMLAIQRIWKRKPIPNYGVSMTETIMTILKHLIKSNAMLSERFHSRMNETLIESKLSEQTKKSQHISPENAASVNADHMTILTDMGFLRQHVLEALHNTNTLEQATEYLLNHPEACCSTASRGSDYTVLNSLSSVSQMDIDASATSSPSTSNFERITSKEKEFLLQPNKNVNAKLKQISKETFNTFCSNTLEKTFAFMEILPETVNTGSDLLTVIYRRQNVSGKQKFIINMVKNLIEHMNYVFVNMDVNKSFENKKQDDMVTGISAKKLNTRLKVLFLLLDEMYSDVRKELCIALCKEQCLNLMIMLLNKTKLILENQNATCIKPTTPCWLQTLVDLMDAIDSVSIILQRKANMQAVCSDVWKWYDTSTGKWNLYSETNNTIIKNAFKTGERSIIINIGRQRYTINFNCMTQVSEASGSHRPVMPGLKITEAIAMHYQNSNQKVQNILTQIIKSDSDLQNIRNPEIFLSLSSMLNFNNDEDGEEPESKSNDIEIEEDHLHQSKDGIENDRKTTKNFKETHSKAPEIQQKIVLDEEPTGLSKHKTEDLIASIVCLLNPKLSLNFETKLSLLKLSARLTKDFQNAKVFVQLGGIRILLKMTQSCGLMGFPTYAIIIIRHVLEAPNVLQESIERILSARTIQSVPVGHRDLIYILTQVSSAVARDPHMFLAASMNILRGDYSTNPTLSIDDSKFLVKSNALNNLKDGMTSNSDNCEVMSKDNYISVTVIKDLLNSIVQPCCHYGGHQLRNNKAGIKSDQLKAATGQKSSDCLPFSSGSIEPEDSYEPCCCSWHIPSSGHNHNKPVLPRATIIKILADAVRSYQSLVPHIIMEHSYSPSDSILIDKQQTCLSFIIDNFLPIIKSQQNAEVSIMSRALITSLSDCYGNTTVQNKVAEEVHQGIIRALLLPESSEKHTRLQVLIGLLPLMIESPMLVNKIHVQRNNMYRILLRQGIMTDLCKISQYIDLSNSYAYSTIFSVLRPLEILLRLTVAPGTLSAKRFLCGNSSQNGNSTINRRFYPRLMSRPNASSSSATVSGDNVLRDIIRNVLSDRRHGFEFMFNTDDFVIDSEASSNTTGISVHDEGDENQQNTTISSANTHTNGRSQLNFNRLLDDFMQNERNFEVLRGSNHRSNNISAAHTGITVTDHHRNSSNNSESGNNGNGEGESDGASSSSETTAVTIDNVTMADVSTSDTNDSDSNASTENDDRNDEDEDDDENHGIEEGADDPSETEPDDETRQFIEVFNHIYDRESSETASNFADIDADDEASEVGINGARVPQSRNTEANFDEAIITHQESELDQTSDVLSDQPAVSFINTTAELNSNIQSNLPLDRHETIVPTTPSAWISPRIAVIDANITNEGIDVSSNFSIERVPAVHSANDNSNNIETDYTNPQRNLASTNSHNTGPNIQRRDSTRRLIFLDQQYCAPMPSFNNPTEEGQLELFNQDALHWWLEEAKHLDFESQTNACLYVGHLLIPFLINKLKEEHRIHKKEDNTNVPVNTSVPSCRRSAIPVPIQQSNLSSVSNTTEATETPNNLSHFVSETEDNHIQDTSTLGLSQTLPRYIPPRLDPQNVLMSPMQELDTNIERNPQLFVFDTFENIDQIRQTTSNSLPNLNFNVTDNTLNETLESSSSNQTIRAEQVGNNIIADERLFGGENFGDDENEINRTYLEDGELNPALNVDLDNEIQNSLIQSISENEGQVALNSVLCNEGPEIHAVLDHNTSATNQNIDNAEGPSGSFSLEEYEGISSVTPDSRVETPTPGINAETSEAFSNIPNIQEITPEERNVLGSLEVPEGVDPSFLAALPEEMREEVIQEHLRMQRVRQRAQQNASQIPHDSVLEVNPEFLAALPPNIQSEVLMQQRIEQQRQAAQTTNPEDPVDAASFFQNLPDSLRQAILTDMDESQIASLPPELAAEAQYLRSDWENRNSSRLNVSQTSALSSSARARFPSTSSSTQDARWQNSIWYGTNGSPQTQNHLHTTIIQHHHTQLHGKPIALLLMEDENNLLDPDSLTTLLLFLFIEDSKINFSRLHRIVRNLCYHVPTREWIIHALISIIQRINNENTSIDFKKSLDPQWLKIRVDTFGFKSNVFIINKIKEENKSSCNSETFSKSCTININPQATQMIICNCLDMLFVLAKYFPRSFVPFNIENKLTVDKSGITPTHSISKNNGSSLSSNVTLSSSTEGKQSLAHHNVLDDLPSTSKEATKINPKTNLKNSSTSDESQYNTNTRSFWDVLLNLDMSTCFRSSNVHAFPVMANPSWEWKKKKKNYLTFSDSSFTKLLEMLPYKDICRSPQLTDMIVKLLASLSVNLPTETEQYEAEPNPDNSQRSMSVDLKDKQEKDYAVSSFQHENKKDTQNKLPKLKKTNQTIYSKNFTQLKLVVEVLTHQSCTIESLDDVAKLINNLSVCSEHYNAIFCHYLKSAILGLAEEVQKSIKNLRDELRHINFFANENTTPTTSKNADKTILQDRFTSQSVVVSAQTNNKSLYQFQLPAMKKLLSASSAQHFFLRTLKIFMQVRELNSNLEMNNTSLMVLNNKQSLSQIIVLDDLWNTLSACLFELEESKDEYAVLVLQPIVEAFFLIYGSQKMESKKNTNIQRTSLDNNSSENQTTEIQTSMELETSNTNCLRTEKEIQSTFETNKNEQTCETDSQIKNDRLKFLSFAEKHRSILNQILRQSPIHLSDGPFAVLVHHTRFLDFDVKRKYFQTELERIDEGVRREENTISVRRVTVFEDSFRVLYRLGSEEWKNRFYIVFEDEEGQDAGGLLREWYVIISREIFNPMYALFCVSPGDRVTYMINPSSYANPNHLSYFKFVGRVIAKAIHDNKLLECYFTRSFYKHILGKQVKYTDMESQDYEFYKGLDYLMKNNVSTLGYELTFSTEVQEFGVTQVRDLIPNGRDIIVTEDNKFEYVQLVCQLKMSGSIRQQLDAFLEGFYDIIPKHLISIFNEQELELLISGLPDIDIEDLKLNTEYHKYTAKSNQIQWFWRALRSFDQADRAKFLQFVTGTSKVPLQGFRSLEGMNGIQKLQIHRDDRSTDRLPCAHTCFNQLDLPMYKSYDKLRSCLLKAIHECSEGFGFA